MRARYPDQVGGDNLESRFGYIGIPSRMGQVCHGRGRLPGLAGVWIDTGVWIDIGLPKTDVV